MINDNLLDTLTYMNGDILNFIVKAMAQVILFFLLYDRVEEMLYVVMFKPA